MIRVEELTGELTELLKKWDEQEGTKEANIDEEILSKTFQRIILVNFLEFKNFLLRILMELFHPKNHSKRFKLILLKVIFYFFFL